MKRPLGVALAAIVLAAPAARAQTFVELGGGWNYAGNAPVGVSYSHGWTARVSVGPRLASNFLLRVDGIMSQLVDSVQIYPPCAFPGCTHAYYNAETINIVGVVVNGILNVDRRGIFYLIGGVGGYDINVRSDEFHMGLSGGAGIAVPVGARLRAVAEARWIGLTGGTTGPGWFAPVTFGVRY